MPDVEVCIESQKVSALKVITVTKG